MSDQALNVSALNRSFIRETITNFVDTDPFSFYERLRELGSPVWDEKADAWLILDFDQCAAVERDESRFVVVYARADDTIRAIKGGGANIIVSQGEFHDRLRRFHLKLLSPVSVERYRHAHIKPIIDLIADRLLESNTLDLMRDFANQIPPRIICSLLGMPYDDDVMIARILELNDHIVDYIAGGYRGDELRNRALAASSELNSMLLPYIRIRREHPTNDFISRVWTESAAAGLYMDEEGALGLCRELYFAGSDTTVHGITNALYVLLANQDLMAQARIDRVKTLNAVIEEGLRLFNVVQFRHRICTVDTLVGNVTIKADQVVILVHAAANRDPVKYECPHSVKLDRKVATDHLAFGRGNRACVGSQLARVEMREAIIALFDRFSSITSDPNMPPPHFQHLYMRSMGPLHVITSR